jgi:hypothetical protein
MPKDKLYDLINDFFNLKRSEEEIILISREMKRLLIYWKDLKLKIENLITELSNKNSKDSEVNFIQNLIIIIIINIQT